MRAEQSRGGLLLSNATLTLYSVQIKMGWGAEAEAGTEFVLHFRDLHRSLNLVQKYLNYSSNC